jgi:hypothetical protein
LLKRGRTSDQPDPSRRFPMTTTPNEFEQAIEDAIEDGWLAYEEDED